ncbi:MAG: hypothetical protein HY908_01370, partial [Myxococcales bacterium]|nr:hypothetical protein [Myxococcales bacterium]
MSGHDLSELRRLVARAFTTSELVELAQHLGVNEPAASNDALARALVRSFEARGAVEELLGVLRRHRPLVEWPSPASQGPGPDPATPAVRGLPAPAVHAAGG